MKRLYGVVVPVVTPLTEDDKIDVESLQRLTDHCIDGGLQCLYPCGTTGEMMYLTVEERKLVAETVVKHAAGRVPVFVHVGAWNQADTIELAKHAVEIGADGIGVVTPSFYAISDRGLIDYYVAVANSVPSDFPVYMYGIKQNAINDLNRNVCQAVAEKCSNVVGVKYSFPDMTRLQELMTVKDGDFDVLVGPDHLFEAVCAVGGKGVVSGNAMCVREHYAALWDAIQKKDYDLATKLQRRTNVLNSTMCAINNIAAYKVILKEEGVLSTTKMRRPMENLTPEQEKDLLDKMHELFYKEVRI
ncbi:MAG: dihydrodipicolinate synthase family protein [Lachnospiraceae bacterium]|nr:dihydrodipicolinate synthase family protein [Lachnospiraceae bacterium]